MNFVDFLFESAGSRQSHEAFVLGQKEQITFAQLYEDVENISVWLRLKRSHQSPYIPICADNSLFFVRSYLAVIKAGLVAVPLDTRASEEYFKDVIEDCEPHLGFVHSRYSDKFPEEIELFDENWLPEAGKEVPPSTPNDEAVVFYTSGSTSRPKGVVLTHGNLISNTQSICETLPIDESTIHEVVLPFFYCYGASLLHTQLRKRAKLVLNNSFMFPDTVLEDIETYGCTAFSGVPSSFQILIQKSHFLDKDLQSLKFLCQAGGRLSPTYIDRIMSAHSSLDFYVMYGQTEATARLSVLDARDLSRKRGSVGKPIPGVEFKLIDKNGMDVASNEVGELLARGQNIMKGYLKSDELTDKTIREGWLHTGDLARVDEEGYYYIVDREKDFIKVAGNRVSSKDIEDSLLHLPGVQEAAVIAVEDEITGEAPRAYVVVESKEALPPKKILRELRLRVPIFKLPREVICLERLPKNSYGKVMKQELKKMARGGHPDQHGW